LIENALDAHSTQITVVLSPTLDDIKVTDNGHGIDKLGRSFVGDTHATSKIRTFEDIYDASLPRHHGFRGQALHLLSTLLLSKLC
jgi:DNA mismatch repair ATPase MutL